MTQLRKTTRLSRRRARSKQRGVALILVLGALTIMTVMLAEFQDTTSAELGSALSHRDELQAEYAARSGVSLTRLLIASEPTVRKSLAFMFMMMKQGAPQIPVWEYANEALGAFNDPSGTAAFASLANVNLEDGKNLGLEGAGFEVKVIDEDAKINVNMAARPDLFSQVRLSEQLLGLMANPQYDKLFENRDADGQFSDRQTICAAIIDWTDMDQDGAICDPGNASAQQAGAEDSFYQLLKKPYPRKNAAFDSLEELRLVRGVGDDFWSTFVEPDPAAPDKRVVTVWGQGKINVNSANGQTLLALICSGVPDRAAAPLCSDPAQAATFLTAITMMRGFTAGIPVFASPKAFVSMITGKGKAGSMLAPVLEGLGFKPVTLKSEAEFMKGIATESKVFSIYVTGNVKAGKRETRSTLHAVVDFRDAPPPGMPPELAAATGMTPDGATAAASGAAGGNLPAGAGADALAGAFAPSPGGNIIYYRVD
jgi:general secretion pathway protein K